MSINALEVAKVLQFLGIRFKSVLSKSSEHSFISASVEHYAFFFILTKGNNKGLTLILVVLILS